MIFKRAVAKLRAQDWVAITIELAIVTLGVLIALAAQQWAEFRAWSNKVERARPRFATNSLNITDMRSSFGWFTRAFRPNFEACAMES